MTLNPFISKTRTAITKCNASSVRSFIRGPNKRTKAVDLWQNNSLAVQELPKLESLKRTIRRQLQSTTNFRPQPATLEDLQILDEYQQTNKGCIFFLFDSGPETQCIVIFGPHKNIEMLEASLVLVN